MVAQGVVVRSQLIGYPADAVRAQMFVEHRHFDLPNHTSRKKEEPKSENLIDILRTNAMSKFLHVFKHKGALFHKIPFGCKIFTHSGFDDSGSHQGQSQNRNESEEHVELEVARALNHKTASQPAHDKLALWSINYCAMVGCPRSSEGVLW